MLRITVVEELPEPRRSEHYARHSKYDQLWDRILKTQGSFVKVEGAGPKDVRQITQAIYVRSKKECIEVHYVTRRNGLLTDIYYYRKA